MQDRAHDVLHSECHPLDAIFMPHNVAVIGASERAGSVGRAVLWSLVSSPFGGTVFPVSEKRSSVLGIKACKKVTEIPEQVDLAAIVTPAASVPGVGPVTVNVVWDPPWEPSRMSDEARMVLNMW